MSFVQLNESALFPAATNCNHRIIAAGQISTPIYTLYAGWAIRTVRLADGRRQIVDFVLPGDAVGVEATYFGSSAHSVETITPASVCRFTQSSFREMVRTSPGFAEAALRSAVGALRCIEQRLVSLGRKTAQERLAALLLNLSARLRATDGTSGLGCYFPPTQRHLADATGLTVTHVNATLRKFKEDGILTLSDKFLRITDQEALVAIAKHTVSHLPEKLLL